MAPALAVRSTDIRLLNLETRLPFEFGIATMTGLPHCFVSVEVAVDGTTVTGRAADHFPPRWLTKDPDRSLEAEATAILEVVERACEHASDVEGDSVFDCWRQVYEAQRRWAPGTEHPPLLWNFGVTFVERALVDAFCRATDRSFHRAVRQNALGTRPEYVYPELEGTVPADHLPEAPARSVAVRHTVGHADPLTATDGDAPDDGLPGTLVENVEAYGLDRFKIKLAGRPTDDHERLRAVFDVLDEVAGDYAFTLDANEQYGSVDELAALFDRLRADDEVGSLDDRLLFVEQPFPRDATLSEEIAAGLRDWQDAPPIIIDESDGPLDSLGVALECGYAGTSYKNCKGVFKGLANACLASRRREAGERVVLSGEDLTTIGPVSLQQDLAAIATLGINHVERNGHHYFRGLSMFDESVQSAVLAAHDDLYRRHEEGYATLDIDAGRIALDSVVEAPFGYAAEVDTTRYDSPEEWRFAAVTE